MRNFIFMLFFVLWEIHANSQQVYYGYPSNDVLLNQGDIIILNIPSFINCRFINLDDFNKLIDLFKSNEKKQLRIEINYFYGDSIFSNYCSEILCRMFKEALEEKTTLKNYHIVNNGCKNPVFLLKSQGERIFKSYNSRIEIIVE